LNLIVFIIDDDEAVRDSLKFLLRSEGFTCRAYESSAEFLAQLQPEHRGCIITDVRMPEMDGISLVHHLNQRGSRIPIIMITGHADVPMAVEAIKAGVAEFIEKPFHSDAIMKAVRECLEVTQASEQVENERAAIERRIASLTEREAQVFVAVADGLSNKDIGVKLAISPRTVEIYRANVMSKMHAESLSGLVRMLLITTAA